MLKRLGAWIYSYRRSFALAILVAGVLALLLLANGGSMDRDGLLAEPSPSVRLALGVCRWARQLWGSAGRDDLLYAGLRTLPRRDAGRVVLVR